MITMTILIGTVHLLHIVRDRLQVFRLQAVIISGKSGVELFPSGTQIQMVFNIKCPTPPQIHTPTHTATTLKLLLP